MIIIFLRIFKMYIPSINPVEISAGNDDGWKYLEQVYILSTLKLAGNCSSWVNDMTVRYNTNHFLLLRYFSLIISPQLLNFPLFRIQKFVVYTAYCRLHNRIWESVFLITFPNSPEPSVIETYNKYFPSTRLCCTALALIYVLTVFLQ
jgi:hypothetical protein